MKIAFRILLIGFFLNLAAGIVLFYIPNIDMKGQVYSSTQIKDFTTQFNNTIDSSSRATDTGNIIDNIIDKLNLGILNKLQAFMDRWMYGLITFIGAVFNLSDYIIFLLKSLMTIAYVLAIINMFSGKDIGYG